MANKHQLKTQEELKNTHSPFRKLCFVINSHPNTSLHHNQSLH